MSVPTTDSKMYQTMHRQPAEIERLVTEGWDQAEVGARLLALARRIFVVGIGTSWHAAMVGAWLLREAGCDARPVSSFDFAIVEECFKYRECAAYSPFVTHGKAVLAAEYSTYSETKCAKAKALKFSLAFYNLNLNGRRYRSCL